jgi:allantoin racemase
MTKILIVNPNTTASMTETIGAAARAVAAPGTEILAVTSAMGPVSIEGYYDEAFAVPGLIQALMNAPDADAAIVACFDDTGLDAARTAARFPVVGICEAALVTAGQIAKRIAVVTTLPRSIVPRELTPIYILIWRLILTYFTLGFGFFVFSSWIRQGLKSVDHGALAEPAG